MTESSKVYIAAKPVTVLGVDTGKKHLYLVYDEDGDPSTSGDQLVLRGGPETESQDRWNTEATFHPGNIELEIAFDLDVSFDDFGPGEDHADRDYTTLNPPGAMTADQFWAALVAEANSMWNGDPDTDDDDRALTDASYTAIGGAAGLNSNSVVASLLAATGVDVYANLPKDGGDAGGPRLSASLFPQLQNLLVGEGENVAIVDGQVGSVTDFGSDASTITIDGADLVSGSSPLKLQADGNSLSADKIVLENISLSDLKYFKRIGNDLWVFLTDDDLIPSLVLKDQFAGKGFNELKIATGAYIYSLTNPSTFPVNAAVLPTPSGGYKAFADGTYDKATLPTTISSNAVDIAWNGKKLFAIDLVGEKVTFASGLEIDDLDVDPGLVLEVPGEAETPIEAILDYLDQLGVTMTAEELAQAEYDDSSPTGTPYTHTSGYVEELSFSAGNYHFNNPPGPNATIEGPEEVTIITGYDGETPIYGQVAPTDIILHASGDLSRDTISNVNVLDVAGGVSLTEAQFEQFNLFTGTGGSGNQFSLTAATGGEFDASEITVDAGAELTALYATSWEGTTLIGSNQNGQELYASLLGDDTLEAGTGNDTKLYAGGGKNTLIGSSSGETTFVVGNGDLNGLAPGSTVTGSGSDNVLEASGDISGATISGVQTLDVSGDITITADQFDDFTAIEGSGILYAASNGTYDWSGKNVTFWDAYALSASGTTLVANAASGIVTLHASESGNDTLSAPTANYVRIFDAANSTGDITFIAGDGDGNIVYTGYGESTITLGEGDNNEVIANHGLASGSSITSDNDTTSLLTANGDISGATISGIHRLETETGVILNATQLAGFDALTVWSDQTIIAASAGTYSLAGKGFAGTGGIVTLIGSSGADTLTGSGFADLLYGGGDADTINGGGGDDILAGGDGDDMITGGTGVDTISGDAGNDTIVIGSGEVPSGEIIDGGDGTDRLTVANSGMTPLATLSNMEELYLDSGVTAINLTAAQLDDFDTITHQNGGSQAFSITAQAAGTYSLAGKTITGVATLNGSSGNDTLTGSSGNDTLRGFAGADTINGGDGNDTIQIFSGEVPSGESIDGGNGTDRLVVGSNNMNPSAMAVANMEELYLNSGVTSLTVSGSQLADFETITHANGGSQAFTLNAAAASTFSLAGKTITGVATLNGTSGADTLTGSSNADTINGNSGNDLIEGGAGNDTLNGGNDTDTLTYANAGSAVTVDLSNASAQNTGGAGTDTISNFENLTGSAYNDTLTGTSSANILLGGDGDDTITGGAGSDTIDGGIGSNTLDGGTGDDTYVLERTYGASDLTDNDSTGGNSDTLQLGADIAPDQMWFRQSGNDLLVNVIGTDAQMTIKDWFLGSDHQVEQIVTDDEDVLDHTAVQNLVSAMSSLTMPGTTTLSPEYHAQLDTVIAANWA
jgi:Ca2+-binding RTX toxin-like protein